MTKNLATKLAVGLLLFGVIFFTVFKRDEPTDITPVEVEETAPINPGDYVVRWQDNELHLEGHTEAHDQGITEAVSALLQRATYGSADVSLDSVRIRAIVADESDWQQQVEAIEQSLPQGVRVSSDIILAATESDAQDLCARAFSALTIGPINFQESGIEFRDSAYPEMEKLAVFSLTCPNLDILITGHTDSSGNPDWNQTLSELRAAAVADFVATLGVDKARLIVAGAGSSEPLASNATRYGRSKNRRIEIGYRPTAVISEQ